ncbi:MAG TPA: VWA domain-containing protein, partial [Thermoanaerobaculia bacterium]|nr:VWA domain-containing protein [Thermoanaerobaculia bacterium]
MPGRLLRLLAPVALLGALAAGPAGAEEPLETACLSTDLPARFTLAFPDSGEGRTRMEATIVVGEADWPARRRSFRLEGELARKDRRVEGFRYRFDPPAEAGPVTFAFVRRPAAGRYRLLLRLLDESSRRCLVDVREVDVPLLGVAPGEDAQVPDAVRLYVGHGLLLTGKVRFDAQVRGEQITRLAFELDGRRVLTRGRPPWTVELDLGTAPRIHRLAAVGLDRRGHEVARDEVLLNSGPHRFTVRLALAPWPLAAGEVIEARAVIEVPEGEELASLELFVNDELRATLYQPPYTVALPRPAGGGSAWVRAVAHLAEGGDAEATRLLGGSAAGEVVDVDFVELLATVVDRSGRPVEDLRQEEIELLENGRQQKLRRLERVEDVPIHAAVMIDTSDSMAEEIDDAIKAADRFFREVLTVRDRAAVITFADEPRLAVRFTSQVERLAGGLVELAARGTTRLYDAVAF